MIKGETSTGCSEIMGARGFVRFYWLGLIAFALVTSAAVPAVASARQPGGESVTPVADLATRALRASLGRAFPAASVRALPRTASEVRTIVAQNVDRGLIAGAVGFYGVDLRVSANAGIDRHAGTLVVRYPSASIAIVRFARLRDGGTGFFNKTKILTPMIAARRGSAIAIFFSESASDVDMRNALKVAAARYGPQGTR